ncbi:MAG: flavodoxin family protein [Ignavibacteria bacterium]|nr:flavodoxin family protein [Ignavibacteria bacterium]
MSRCIRATTFAILIPLACGQLFGQDRSTVLVVYYSMEGHTRAMAEAVAKGAQSSGRVTVKLLSVEQATTEDVLTADAIIVGTPVHNANVATPVQQFINRWPFEGAPLRDKIGAAFVTAGGISAGEELAQLNILHSMLIFGMVVVGGPDWQSAFGASAVTMEQPFGRGQKKGEVDEYFFKKGEALGKRVADLTLKWRSVHQNK